LPLALLEQPFFHDLVLCSFHSPFTSACWATWLPAWIVEGGSTKSDLRSWHSWLTGTVTAAMRRTWWITGPFLARRTAHPTLTLTGWNVFLLRKKRTVENESWFYHIFRKNSVLVHAKTTTSYDTVENALTHIVLIQIPG
jgi:hypothetical protein